MKAADELRQAAEKLRELISRLECEGAWIVPNRAAGQGHRVICAAAQHGPGEDWEPIAECADRSDAHYIAALHPRMGAALATFLEETAETWGMIGAPEHTVDDYSELMDVVRLINGADYRAEPPR